MKSTNNSSIQNQYRMDKDVYLRCKDVDPDTVRVGTAADLGIPEAPKFVINDGVSLIEYPEDTPRSVIEASEKIVDIPVEARHLTYHMQKIAGCCNLYLDMIVDCVISIIHNAESYHIMKQDLLNEGDDAVDRNEIADAMNAICKDYVMLRLSYNKLMNENEKILTDENVVKSLDKILSYMLDLPCMDELHAEDAKPFTFDDRMAISIDLSDFVLMKLEHMNKS